MRHTCEPHKQGLYDPRFEHDACGIGFVADIKGRKSHEIVQKAIQVLLNLNHQLGVELNERGNVAVDRNKKTNVPGVFAAGDVERGQSLVVWAIADGRRAAREVDRYLMGDTVLP